MAEQEIQEMTRPVLGLLAILGILLVATLIAVIVVG